VKGYGSEAGAAVAIPALGGAQLNSVVSTDWQVSTIIVTSPCGILAAPQQSPSLQVVSSLYGLKVPLDMAFSHLAPAAPRAGSASIWAWTRAVIVAKSATCSATANSKVAVYSSNFSS